MIIRDGTFDDFILLLPIMHEAHQGSMFKDIPMNEATLQRNYVTAMMFKKGFVKVIEKDGEVLGGMVGVIAENHYGIICAQDLFTYSRGGTDMLITAFRRWARNNGALFTQITDQSEGNRYQKLITNLGLVQGGINFVEVA